jgi:hypothetical protein
MTLRELVADLERARGAVTVGARPILKASAEAVKADWRDTWPWSGSRNLKGLGDTVTYEIRGLSVEIGPVKGGVGSLGNLIEFGSINNPPHPGGDGAIATEAPRFEAAMAAMAMAVLAGGSQVGVFNSRSAPSRFNTGFNTLA